MPARLRMRSGAGRPRRSNGRGSWRAERAAAGSGAIGRSPTMLRPTSRGRRRLDPHPDGPAVPDLVEAPEDSPRARPKGQFVVAGERQTVLEQVERDGGKELNERFDPRLEGCHAVTSLRTVGPATVEGSNPSSPAKTTRSWGLISSD